jgi:hypothetical protein
VVSASDSGAAAVASRAPRGEGCAMTHAGRAGNHRHPVSAASLALAGIECDMSCRSSGFTRTGGVKQQVRQEPSACVTGRLRTWVAACHCRVRRNRPSLDTLRSSASAKRPPRNSSKQPRDDDHRSRLKDWRTSCLGGRSFQNPNRCWRLVPRRTASMFAVTVCSASGRLYETLHRPTIFTGKDRGGGATGVSSNRPPLRQWLWETGDQFNARSLRAAGTDVQGGRNAETAGRYRCGRQGRGRNYAAGTTNMVIEHGIPTGFIVFGIVLCLFWLPVVALVAVVQKRSIWPAIILGLLGPFGFYAFPRLPPRKPRTPLSTRIGTQVTIGTDIGTANDGRTTTYPTTRRHRDSCRVRSQKQAVVPAWPRPAGTPTRVRPRGRAGYAGRGCAGKLARRPMVRRPPVVITRRGRRRSSCRHRAHRVGDRQGQHQPDRVVGQRIPDGEPDLTDDDPPASPRPGRLRLRCGGHPTSTLAICLSHTVGYWCR